MVSFDELKARLGTIRATIEKSAALSGRTINDIRLVVVTKTHPIEMVQRVVDAGIRDIGENRVQELVAKAPLVKGDVCWHMIGHLQTNKVRKVLEHASWIQSVDSDRLADEIDARSAGLPARVKTLVEVNTSGEASKSGCEPGAAVGLCERVAAGKNMEFCGLMTVGPLYGGESETRRAFAQLRSIGESVRHLAGKIELSMGMSSDFAWAIEEGSTMVRIGSRLLGERQ
jgi:PLP dependent protein